MPPGLDASNEEQFEIFMELYELSRISAKDLTMKQQFKEQREGLVRINVN